MNGVAVTQGDYFFYHHSDADTMEILDSAQMDRAVAMWAAYTYVVGNLEEMLPRLEPGEEAPTQEVCPHAQLLFYKHSSQRRRLSS